jgi:hypothetical protein
MMIAARFHPGALLCVAEPDAPLGAVSQQPLKLRQIPRRRDDENISDSGEHEHGQGIIDHRLVVDWKELFRDSFGYGMEPGRPSAGEKNSTHRCPLNRATALGVLIPRMLIDFVGDPNVTMKAGEGRPRFC